MRKMLFNMEYSFLQKAIPLVGVFGFFGNITFFFILHFAFCYWESFPVRITASILSLTLFLTPREGPLSRWNKIHLEAVVALILPAFFSFMFLKNEGNVYWFSSLVFAGLLHGLLSKPLIFVWIYPIGSNAATYVFMRSAPDATPLVIYGLQAQLVAYFLGMISSGIKSGMEYSHLKIIRTELALAHAQSELVRTEEIRKAYEELKKREELIRVFVRPSLVDEIHAGKDPSKFEPKVTNLTVMFCDIRDFTRLTEVQSPYEKQTFLNQYFSLMTHPIVQNGGEVDKIIGDSVMGIFPDGDSAVKAAVAMRLELQKFNQGMYSVGNPKIRNGIGIAKGEVLQGNFGSFEKLDRTVIGEAVNIASRLESKTKMYNLEVVVTEEVINDLALGSSHYRWIDFVQVKGSTRHIKLYEIYGHQPQEVRKFKDDTRELLEKALTIYFQKGFKDASRLFRAMLNQVPPHTHLPNDLMDNILKYYIAHCDAWINDSSGAWEQIERWDGVHIFNEK